MLVLTRREGESVVVTDQAGHIMTVTVNTIQGGRVKLAFDAPREHFTIERDKRREDE